MLICAKGSNGVRSLRMSETSHAQPVPGRIDERFDNPLERLRLLAGDDDAIASFLDELDVQSPREREMLRELARTRSLDDRDARHPPAIVLACVRTCGRPHPCPQGQSLECWRPTAQGDASAWR